MHLDPILPSIVAVLFTLALLGLFARLIRQPTVIGYILAGVLIGPYGFGVVTNSEVLNRLGAFGVVLLLFALGLEIAPRKFAANWRVALVGTSLQIGITTCFALLVGYSLDWPIGRSVLIGFVLALSSTAVVIKIFNDAGLIDTETGQDVLSVLLTQDLAVIPMLLTLQFLAGEATSSGQLLTQGAGAVALIALATFAVVRGDIRLPYREHFAADTELQVFMVVCICFGLALLAGLAGMSTALGAFVAGILIRATRGIDWAEQSIHSLRTILMALFFASVGALVDLHFIQQAWREIVLLTLSAIVLNSVINTAMLKTCGRSWRNALFAGIALSQIGEFSFVLAAVGLTAGLISDYGYQLVVAIIAFSLLLSPMCIAVARRLLLVEPETSRENER